MRASSKSLYFQIEVVNPDIEKFDKIPGFLAALNEQGATLRINCRVF